MRRAKGEHSHLPAPGYKWNETPRLNRAIWARHRDRSTKASRADFDAGHREIVRLVQRLSAEQIRIALHFCGPSRGSQTENVVPRPPMNVAASPKAFHLPAQHYRWAAATKTLVSLLVTSRVAAR